MMNWLHTTEPARYLTVGAACALVNNAMLIVLAAIGLHYLACIAINFATMLPISYLLHARWTFVAPVAWKNFAAYTAGAVSSLVIASLSIVVLCGPLGLPMFVSAPLATIFMVTYNFVIARLTVRGVARSGGQDPSIIDPARPSSSSGS